MGVRRRTFLSGVVTATVACVPHGRNSQAAIEEKAYATLTDLTQCDGCEG